MTSAIDTLGKAARHDMIVRAECPACGKRQFYRASDLMMVFGPGRDPRGLPFGACRSCTPRPRITVHEIDDERTRRLQIRKPIFDRDRRLLRWELAWL